LNDQLQRPEELFTNFREELLSIIDEFLISVSNQKLVDSNRVQDFCLDLRLAVDVNLKENRDDN